VGLTFALEMVQRTGVPVGLIPCAHGGTSMAQWDPVLKDKGGDSLYGAMLRRFQLAGGRVKGVLWYQGESDASPQAGPLFEEKFRDFIKAVRADFGQPELGFYYVQIGRHVSGAGAAQWNLVQNAQLRVETQLPNVFMTGCADCELDDGIHVGTDDFKLLGKRLASLAQGTQRRGPRPVAARVKGSVIEVEFAEVNGRLVHAGRLTGFTIHDAAGTAAPLIYRQRVSAVNPNVVELLIGGKLPEGAMLHHGAGRDPYVNLRDEAGMPAPVFGPLALQQ
jgi:sialate O-acetylesterase